MGARIKAARKELGMTQLELAALGDFSQRSLQEYERGTTLPYKHLRQLSDILDKPLRWLLHGEDTHCALYNRLDQFESSLAALHILLREIARKLDVELSPSGIKSTGDGTATY